MASPNITSPLGSPEDVALNRAILASLQQVNNVQQTLPPPAWNNQTQYIPVQTTTTYIPIPQPGTNRTPVIPNLTQTQPLQVAQPTVRIPTFTQTQPLQVAQPTVHIPTFTQTVPTFTQPIIPLAPMGTNRIPAVPIPKPTIPLAQTNNFPIVHQPSPVIPTPQNQLNIPTYTQLQQETVRIPVTVPRVTTTARNNTTIPPILNTQLQQGTVRIPVTVPRVTTTARNNTTIPPIPKTQIPIIPPLATTTTRKEIVGPSSPRTNLPPLQTVQLSPRSPPTQRSPGRMTREEEDQLRIAIMASLQEVTGLPIMEPPAIIMTPPRNPLMSPLTKGETQRNDDEDIEDALLQEAIEASILAAEQARLANFHANQVLTAPKSPSPLSPRTRQILEYRAIKEEQDREYQEALRIDTEKADNAKKAAEAATKAAEAAEVAAHKLQEAKLAEDAKRDALQPPILKYSIEATDMKDFYLLVFKLPNGSRINHSFHKQEPLSSVIQQLRFDLKHLGEFTLTISPNIVINCGTETPISSCGIQNRTLIFVTYA